MKKLVGFLGMTLAFGVSYGQQYYSRTGMVGFHASTPLEDITAENDQVYVIVDVSKKQLAFSSLLKGFIFPKELMQEHFNENYVESDKYPKATFTGSFSGDVDLHKEGRYAVRVKGELSVHNTTKMVEAPATLEVKGGTLIATAQLVVKPEDFQIAIPSVVRNKIAKEVTVNVNANCIPK
jgi:polyisoprenoid-binding protein YceI